MFNRLTQSWWPLTAVFLLILLLTPTPTLANDSKWRVRYWNNATLSGDPALVRHESKIDHDWGDGSPNEAINTDAFSARWTRTVNFAAGTYRFSVTSDDGMRVYLDGNKIIDVWYDSQSHTTTTDVYVAGGNHSLKVEYYEAGGGAIAKFSYAPVGSAEQTGNWSGEYFNNPNLSGAPTAMRTDPQINFNWTGTPIGGLGPDLFSIRWKNTLQLAGGSYRFNVTADDGVRLYVNNQLVIDQWKEQPVQSFSATVNLPAGSIPVVMEYFEKGGNAIANLSWTRLSGPAVAPPSNPVQSIGEWKAEYFNNENLAGSPVLTRNEIRIDHTWGSSSPVPNVVNNDKFSVRWTRNLNLPAGVTVFTMEADDGARLYVNNQLVIDQWQLQDVSTYSAAVNLPGGAIPMRMEYFEFTGLAEARLSWWSGQANTPVTPAPAPPVPHTAVPGSSTAVMTGAAHLNVRAGAGLEFESIDHLSRNETVTLLGRDAFTIWVKIRRTNGTVGWVSGRFLNGGIPLNTLPITAD